MSGLAALLRRFQRPKLDSVRLSGEGIGAYQEFWDESARTDALNAVALGVKDFWQSGQNEVEMLKKYLPADAAVLEVGCGVGRIMLHLAPLCKELHGVDISSEMLQKAESALGGLPNVHLHSGNGYDLPFGPETFDLTYSCRVFQHMPKNVVLYSLREVYRVLRPGRQFVLQVPNLLLDEHMLAFTHFAQPVFFRKPYPMYFYTPDEIDRLGTFVGFRVAIVDDWLLAILSKP